MQTAVRLTVLGEPRAKQRPRRGPNGAFYTPAETKQAEADLSAMIRLHLSGPVADPDHAFTVEASFHSGTWHRKDLDNYLKLVLDAANAVVWADDSQVTRIIARLERGSQEPATHLIIYTNPDKFRREKP